MNFILYRHTPVAEVAKELGEPEYSYFFVMREFRRVLERLGAVHVVRDPEREVDRLYDALTARGEDALFVCFAPPNKCPVDLRCPTTSVFAWEFETLPDEQWDDDPRTDWRYVFRKHGRAITLSHLAARLVRNAMGDDFPVAVIPVPAWDRFAELRGASRTLPTCEAADLEIAGVVLDERQLCDPDGRFDDLPARSWSGDPIHLRFTLGDRNGALLNGFYESEYWGAWSRAAEPSVTLPCAVAGPLRLTLVARAFGPNAGRPLPLALGDARRTVTLGPLNTRVALDLAPGTETNTLHFSGLDLTPISHVKDPRSMGIGLASLTIERLDSAAGPGGTDPSPSSVAHDVPVGSPAEEHPIRRIARAHLAGVVYTSVLNPADGRKNWKDMVSAFIWAFRDTPDAQLVLKMTHHDIFSYLNEFRIHLNRHLPFRCRVSLIHGYLDEPSYATLIEATSYYVNTSGSEGLCMPLLEFMSCGKPCIAPAHTAMLDYLTDENGFEVRCWRDHNIWPHDPRHRFRTTMYRLDWESLVEAYRGSYHVARSSPSRYQEMSRNAMATMEGYCSEAVVEQLLGDFVQPPLVPQ